LRRRAFIAGLGGAAAWPAVARAQQPKIWRLGLFFTAPSSDPTPKQLTKALLQELEKLGWIVGTNLQIEVRNGGIDDTAQTQSAARGLVAMQPDLIQTAATPGTTAILKETHTIPVVFSIVSDPIGSGFVESFAHPGGNATGFSNLAPSMGSKWVQILKEVAPHVSRARLLFNPRTTTLRYFQTTFEEAAEKFSIILNMAPVENVSAIEPEIVAISQEFNAGLIVPPDTFTYTHREVIVSLVNRERVPAVYSFPEFAKIGGLLAFGVDAADSYRLSATYIDRILKGTKPAELPVQFAVKFQLVVNLKTAKAQDLTLPATLLSTADEVIE
jgi:putative ABC transport system substrate-binding protein